MPKVSIDIDGQKIVIEDSARAKNLNSALKDPAKFKEFAKDPAAFAQSHGVHIDPALANQIASKLKGRQSLAEVLRPRDEGDGGDGGGNGNGPNVAAITMGLVITDGPGVIAL